MFLVLNLFFFSDFIAHCLCVRARAHMENENENNVCQAVIKCTFIKSIIFSSSFHFIIVVVVVVCAEQKLLYTVDLNFRCHSRGSSVGLVTF